jgi:hypothetical protein
MALGGVTVGTNLTGEEVFALEDVGFHCNRKMHCHHVVD